MLAHTRTSRLSRIFIPTLLFVSFICISALPGKGPESQPSVTAIAPQRSYAAFTLTTSRTITRPDERERQLSRQQRFQRSDGAFKVIQTDLRAEGTVRTQTIFGYLGLGMFRLDEANRRLVFIGPHLDETSGNLEQVLREHPLFVRTESVQGVNAIVWRKGAADAEEFSEEFRAPSLGGMVIRRVKVSQRGRETVEPLTIEMAEPAANLFTELFTYPVDYTNFEQRIGETEGRNSPEVAGFMRETLARMRQRRP